MRRVALGPLLAAGLLVGGSASAAPVTSDVRLEIEVRGVASVQVTFTGVTVDVTSTTVTLPPAVATGLGIVVPVTASTAIMGVAAETLGIAGGVFSLGGVTNQFSNEVCPAQIPAGWVCNAGAGLGGTMGLAGTLDLTVVPNIVVVPLLLGAPSLIGQGGSTAGVTSSTDAALFTTRTGFLNTGAATLTTRGDTEPLSLVSPARIRNGVLNFVPVFVRVTVLSVPEPTSLLLLLAGGLGLGALRYGPRG